MAGTKKKVAKSELGVSDNLEIRYPENLPTSYVNHVSLLLSNHDVTLDLGMRHLTQLPGEKSPKGFNQIDQRVMMSLQHAKVFAEKLTGLIAIYENDFGKILTEPKKKDE